MSFSACKLVSFQLAHLGACELVSLVLVQAATRISSRNNKGVPSVRLSMGGNAAIATCHGCQQTFSITDVEWAICRHGLESHWSCLKKMHVEFEHKSRINVIEFEAHVLKFKGQNAQFGNILVPKLAFCSFGKATS